MFTHKCFIKVCNGFIIDGLKKICYVTEDQIMSTDSIIMTIPWSGRFISFDDGADVEIKKAYREIIDCGTNEELFLAIAALRDDSDRFQWFVDDFDDSIWQKSEWNNANFTKAHKATLEELIKHFTV